MNVAVLGTLARRGAIPDTLFSPTNMTSNIAPSPYSASASTEYSIGGSWKAYAAFGGTVGTFPYWLAKTSTGWLKLDLGSGNTAKLYTYKVSVNTVPEPNRAPKDWTMEGSNNDSDWDTLDTVTGQTSWGSGEEREFTCDVTGTSYRYFRINITANNGDSLLQVAELKLYGTPDFDFTYPRYNMTSNSEPEGTASASTEANSLNAAYKAFDGSTATKWTANATTGWLAYEHTEAMTIVRYAVTGCISGQETYAPKDWTFEGYDGEDWVTLDTQTDQTDWSALEVRTFTISSCQYTKVRINITANNGHASNVTIVTLQMMNFSE